MACMQKMVKSIKAKEINGIYLLGVLEKLEDTPDVESLLDPPNVKPESLELKSQLPNCTSSCWKLPPR